MLQTNLLFRNIFKFMEIIMSYNLRIDYFSIIIIIAVSIILFEDFSKMSSSQL